ncbi:MAG: hypothetical protein TR69_WS6001000307 [candidate division WS6 bacterium OLB20]|uniref:Prepilin-type N-terminal cleavage/methylation domain-containing protein n=1 Tax=candidate division WS6 bacterium OLB20 TaxID=1617426 RepID=A0A136M0K3_9BACT|nr:MAG: hypothetical protein TR69_WS6001000307 [candidate division WS6 bacterium OLB20]
MKHKAFTMLEIVVVMGVLVAIALVSIPLTVSSIIQTNADAYMRDMTSRFFLQQQLSFSGNGGNDHGIAFDADGITVFTGPSLASATDTAEFGLPSGVAFDETAFGGGATEVVFASGSFRPDVFGYASYTDGTYQHRLQVNSEGLIEYLKTAL